MADAETSYINVVSADHVVPSFEETPSSASVSEDQLEPKRCGHMRGKELIETRGMTLKIEAPHKAKQDSDFILNACTDAIAVEGIQGEARQGICRTGCRYDVP